MVDEDTDLTESYGDGPGELSAQEYPVMCFIGGGDRFIDAHFDIIIVIIIIIRITTAGQTETEPLINTIIIRSVCISLSRGWTIQIKVLL